jgi:2-amino-4-hydroxy-6-hydroxymethyldihydropteridine diphosphokinase
MSQALIGLGSNLGDRRELLDAAVAQLNATDGVQIVHVSSWHETRPIGGPKSQPEFLNGAALLQTSLSPEALGARLQQIEIGLGRNRRQRWGPRSIDLDLLLFDDLIRQEPTLQLPHPRMAFRRFVLEPAVEIVPAMRHPTIGWTVSQLLEHLNTAIDYVAVSSNLCASQHNLAAIAAAQTGWRRIDFHGEIESIPIDYSPSLTQSAAIEFLRRQAQLLTTSYWRHDTTGAVSSFWIEDLLAIGDVLWPGKLNAVWETLSEAVVRPKLLVCGIQTSTKEVVIGAAAGNPNSPQLAADIQRLQAIQLAHTARAQRPGIGPVLWLNTQDTAGAEVELIAAIQAMS